MISKEWLEDGGYKVVYKHGNDDVWARADKGIQFILKPSVCGCNTEKSKLKLFGKRVPFKFIYLHYYNEGDGRFDITECPHIEILSKISPMLSDYDRREIYKRIVADRETERFIIEEDLIVGMTNG